MLLNPNSDYFYSCNRLPTRTSPTNDINRGNIIARTFTYVRMINQDMLQVTPDLTMKILPLEKSSSHEEYRKYCQLSLLSDKTYLFPPILGWFDFVGLPFQWHVRYLMQMEKLSPEEAVIKASQKDSNAKGNLFIVYDSIEFGFDEMKPSDLQSREILFMILHGLYLGRKFFNLNHGSLTRRDFMFKKTKPVEFDFNVEDRRFILENIQYVPVIVDFGYETSTLNEVHWSSDLEDLQKIFPSHVDLYSQSDWQTSVYSYSNDYQAIKRILHSNYFARYFTREDNFIRPPIGTGTFNRVYQAYDLNSVTRFGIVAKKSDQMRERMTMFNESQDVLDELYELPLGPSMYQQIGPGEWITEPSNDITIIDLQDKGKNLIYAQKIEYLQGDSLATDLFPTIEGCFSLVWFLYVGYYSNMRHRDIKGENCVIRTYPEKQKFTFQTNKYHFEIVTNRIPVLIDFDVATLEPDARFRHAMGTIYTCPPGLLIARFNETNQFDDKTYDWWSLGITLFGWFTWNVLTDFEQYTNIVNLYFYKINEANYNALKKLGREDEFEQIRPAKTQLLIIATLIFYTHVNYVIDFDYDNEIENANLYGFLDPIAEEIIFSLSNSLQIKEAIQRYTKIPIEVKTLIRKFLSNDMEERVENMEETMKVCFGGREKKEKGADYEFLEKLQIDFSPKKSPLPAFEQLDTSFNISPKKLKLQEKDNESTYVYTKGDFVATEF